VARPQTGLDRADLVYEEPVEAGITRLVAVYQCDGAALVGSIRSARAVDAQILDQLSKPIFMHVGGIAPVISLIRQARLFDEDLTGRGYIVQNPPGRYAPYDTYVPTAAGWLLHPEDRTPPAPLFTYSTTPPAGTPVTSIHIPFSWASDNTWSWDSQHRSWKLSIGGLRAALTDASQISVSNVIVQKVRVSYGPWVENSKGDPEVQSQLAGNGPVMVFADGRMTAGTWRRTSNTGPTRLIARNGVPIALQPGETWIELVPSNVSVTFARSQLKTAPVGSARGVVP
jgi:hypothetical protein